MTGPEILVHRTADVLAASAAARLVTTLVDLQASKGSASVVLTGGGVGIAVLEQLRRSPAREAVDWSRLDLYWGDERFVPAGDAERNELQARETLLDHVPVDPARVHPMAASDGAFGDDPDAAADVYARLLAEDASGRGDVPTFDIALLGVGPEGHVASVFPESPAVYETDASVVAVRNCPKPPPTRVSLTLPTIRHASEVWLLAAGQGKADALALALSGAGEIQLPVAGATGRSRTLWLLDEPAAAKLDHR
ncbi:6-phosphogluconolactonase [Haloechinothrix halophila]|uniref:6-phosphogluconolactonase n=1 Tax=Haloechinothrix halophila TaxID=1069073 RepID=UPI00040AE3FE|nr:6-phosphogluconolactonase [Haloechinothrix halophila]